jgi:hypothetical protein
MGSNQTFAAQRMNVNFVLHSHSGSGIKRLTGGVHESRRNVQAYGALALGLFPARVSFGMERGTGGTGFTLRNGGHRPAEHI